MLRAGLRVGALIGTTMAECSPDFAGELGQDAVGVFASDRPTGGFRPDVLDPDGVWPVPAAGDRMDRGDAAIGGRRQGPGSWPETRWVRVHHHRARADRVSSGRAARGGTLRLQRRLGPGPRCPACGGRNGALTRP